MFFYHLGALGYEAPGFKEIAMKEMSTPRAPRASQMATSLTCKATVKHVRQAWDFKHQEDRDRDPCAGTSAKGSLNLGV